MTLGKVGLELFVSHVCVVDQEEGAEEDERKEREREKKQNKCFGEIVCQNLLIYEHND